MVKNVLGGKGKLVIGAVTTVAALVGGVFVKNAVSEPGKIEASPAAAMKAIGEEKTIEFVIQGGINFGKRVLLNSNKNFKADDNMTVVIETAKVPEASGWDPKTMKGKTVKASGVISQYQGKPQLVVTDPKKVEIK